VLHDYLLVGRAGLEPAHLPHIRRAPLPVWLPPLGTERGSRPPGLPRMKRALCQLSYLGAVLTPGVEPDPAAYQTAMQTAYTRSGRKVEVPTPRDLWDPACRFSGPVPAPAGHLPCAESGSLEDHGRSRALVSSEAQHPGWFTLRAEPRIRTENLPVLGRAPLSNWARSAWSRWRDSNSRPPPWQGDALPAALHLHGAPDRNRTA
jgi:hypothetical protein